MNLREAFEKIKGEKFEITRSSLKIFNDDLTVKDEFEGAEIGDLFAQYENKSFRHIYLYENWTDFYNFRYSNLDNNNYINLIQKKNCEKKEKRIDVKNLDEFIEILENLENEFKKHF